MAFVVYGVGAIGGTVAARLILSGEAVRGIARGAQLAAIHANGLLLKTPEGNHRVRFRCVAEPAEAGIGLDDVILLTMKGQDTYDALVQLAAAGVTNQPVVCMQNGVDNERQALRFFPNVYGATVMMPSTYVVPGEVANFGMPKAGIFDIGRYPAGIDHTVERLATALDKAGFAAFPHETVMQSKYAKLLSNLGNVLDAALGAEGRERFSPAVRAEGDTVLRAAGIAFEAGGPLDQRQPELMTPVSIADAERVGSSTAQSLVRHSGSIETDQLNGEICLLGRLHGVPTPLNDWLCGLGRRLIRDKVKAGAISVDEVARAFAPVTGQASA